MSTTLHAAILILLWAAWPQTGFVLLYGFTSPWWQTPIGRALMMKSTGLAVVLDLGFIRYFRPTWFHQSDLLILVVYCLVAAGICYQFFVLVKSRWQAWHETRDWRSVSRSELG